MKRLVVALAVLLALVLSFSSPVSISAEVKRAPPAAQPTNAEREHLIENFLEAIAVLYHRTVTPEELTILRIKCRALARNDGTLPCFDGLDPHTRYITPSMVEERKADARYTGIGIEMSRSETPPGIRIDAVTQNSPAERSGMRAKDVIVRINGESAASMTLEKIVSLIRGETGTSVMLTITRPGETNTRSLSVVREHIVVSRIQARLLADGTGYVRLRDFEDGAAEEVRRAIEDLKQQSGKAYMPLILDLRSNPGGRVNEAARILNLFLPARKYIVNGVYNNLAGTIVQAVARDRMLPPPMYATGSEDVIQGAPLVVLINGHSASASELVAGALRTHGRAVIAGVEASFGKGTIQTWIPLDNGGVFAVTRGQYVVGPAGCELAVQNVGITPDIFIERQERDIRPQKRERDLKNAVPAYQPTGTCRYRFAVPESHKSEARRMLGALGLRPIAPPQN